MEDYTHRVNYYECDRMGITHHSNYIRFMEEARIYVLEQLGYGFEKMEADGVSSPVISVEAEYKKPTTFADVISIHVFVVEMSELKMTFGYEMRCKGALVFKGRSGHCFFEGGRPIQLSVRYPGLYAMLQEMKK